MILNVYFARPILLADYTESLANNIDERINSPFKAFSHKSTQLYIYNKSIWKKATKFDIKNIFFKIQVQNFE